MAELISWWIQLVIFVNYAHLNDCTYWDTFLLCHGYEIIYSNMHASEGTTLSSGVNFLQQKMVTNCQRIVSCLGALNSVVTF